MHGLPGGRGDTEALVHDVHVVPGTKLEVAWDNVTGNNTGYFPGPPPAVEEGKGDHWDMQDKVEMERVEMGMSGMNMSDTAEGDGYRAAGKVIHGGEERGRKVGAT